MFKTNELSAAAHGDLLRSFVSADTQQQVLLFNDLSLHYYQNRHRLWQREEALSQITQVEVFDQSLIKQSSSIQEAEIAQMRQMQEPVSLVEVPVRIIQRRIENFQLIYNSIMSLFASPDASSPEAAMISKDAQSNEYGFDKTLVFLTKANKLIAISSLKGDLIWSRLIKDPVRRMVL